MLDAISNHLLTPKSNINPDQVICNMATTWRQQFSHLRQIALYYTLTYGGILVQKTHIYIFTTINHKCSYICKLQICIYYNRIDCKSIPTIIWCIHIYWCTWHRHKDDGICECELVLFMGTSWGACRLFMPIFSRKPITQGGVRDLWRTRFRCDFIAYCKRWANTW